MKKIFIRIICLALCAFALVCSAAMAEAAFTLDYAGKITHISMDSDTVALRIPASIGGTDVRGIAADVFAAYPNLKYIHLEVPNLRYFANDSLDFSSAENLECIYLNSEITESILKKFKTNGYTDILGYMDLADKSITNVTITYENGVVRLAFANIIPDGYSGYNYRVTRSEQNSSASDRFDSDRDYSNFSISNGMVTFTDVSAEPGQDYYYEIVAMSPFSQTPGYETGISIPAAEGEDKPLPETGDGANLVLWASLAVIGTLGMVLMRRKRA